MGRGYIRQNKWVEAIILQYIKGTVSHSFTQDMMAEERSRGHDSIVHQGDCLIQDMMGLKLGDEQGWHVDSVGGRGKNRSWTAKSRGRQVRSVRVHGINHGFRGRGKLGQIRILVFIILKQFQSIDIGYLSEKRGRVIRQGLGLHDQNICSRFIFLRNFHSSNFLYFRGSIQHNRNSHQSPWQQDNSSGQAVLCTDCLPWIEARQRRLQHKTGRGDCDQG